jgi:dTDP-4-dehydrorhamnose 3,5-epimerase
VIFHEAELPGAFVIKLERVEDERGYFARAWSQTEFRDHGLAADVVQGNVAYNHRRGTLRGMHYQVAPRQEAKLVRCTAGRIYDVIIDLRPTSATFKRWTGVELRGGDGRMFYVPEGFAHGYQTLADETEVFYLVSESYTPGAERGVRWDDPAFSIDWPLVERRIVSEKDRGWPDFSER